MTHHDHHGTTKAEHSTHLTIEDAAGLSTSLALDVNTFIIKGHVGQTFYVILTETADDAVRTSDGDGQTTTVALEAATDAHVLGGGIQCLLGLLTGGSHHLGMFAGLFGSTALSSQTTLLGLASPALGSLFLLLALGG